LDVIISNEAQGKSVGQNRKNTVSFGNMWPNGEVWSAAFAFIFYSHLFSLRPLPILEADLLLLKSKPRYRSSTK
jgi:hypothetical protein